MATPHTVSSDEFPPPARTLSDFFAATAALPEAARAANTPVEVWHQDEAPAANVSCFGEPAS